VGNIFSSLLRTISLIRRTDGPTRFHLIAARRSARRKRALLLTPLVIGVLILAVGQGREAISRVAKEKIIAALKDPLSLFTDRSPGERRLGALLASKKGGPRERVLSTVRDRPQAADASPTDNPIFTPPPAFESTSPPPGIPPASGPPFSDTPFFFPGPPRGAPPGGIPPQGLPPGGIPPGETPPGGIPPGGIPPGGTPPGGTPPGGPPETPPVPIPEPATWTVMLLGLAAAGAVARAARRSQ
jgi:hypothetical protein